MSDNTLIATPAATVVLMREAAGHPEILMVERAGGLGFAGGAMVFPGGKVDPTDLATARDVDVAQGFEALDDTDAAGRIAAAREAFEETGVLLCSGRPVDLAARTAWRARLNSVPDSQEASVYGNFLRASGRSIDAARLVPYAHWCPPPGLHRRFDTLFYLAVLPPGEDVSPDGSEAVSAHWTTAQDVIARADAGEVKVIFPTRRNLERLAQYPTIDALLARLREIPVTRIQPQIVDRDGAKWLTIPADCDYPVTEEKIESAMRS